MRDAVSLAVALYVALAVALYVALAVAVRDAVSLAVALYAALAAAVNYMNTVSSDAAAVHRWSPASFAKLCWHASQPP